MRVKHSMQPHVKIFLLVNILALSLVAPAVAALVLLAAFYINGGSKNNG